MTFPSPGFEPPIVQSLPATTMPPLALPRLRVADASVPMKFPWIVAPLPPSPVIP